VHFISSGQEMDLAHSAGPGTRTGQLAH